MIDHTEGGSWLLGECQRHGFNLKYTEVLPPFPSLEICESSGIVAALKEQSNLGIVFLARASRPECSPHADPLGSVLNPRGTDLGHEPPS